MRMVVKDVGGHTPDFFDRAERFKKERNPDYDLGIGNAQWFVTEIMRLNLDVQHTTAAIEWAKQAALTGSWRVRVLINMTFGDVVRERLNLR
jgi:hypothetical protein